MRARLLVCRAALAGLRGDSGPSSFQAACAGVG
jgi:hypothetical protein